MKILSSKYISVQQVDKNKYLTWTSTIYILFLPKVVFELTDNGVIKNYKVKRFWLSVLLNLIFVAIIWFIYLYIEKLSFKNTIDSFLPLLLGYFILLIIVNYITIRTIKREVKKQVEE
jgi:hypothetical protein